MLPFNSVTLGKSHSFPEPHFPAVVWDPATTPSSLTSNQALLTEAMGNFGQVEFHSLSQILIYKTRTDGRVTV